MERSEPKNPGAPLVAGHALLSQNDPKGAIEAYTAATKLKLDLGEAYRGLGNAHQALRQVDRAIESYRKAILLDGNDAASLNNLAWLLLEKKSLDEALPLAQKASELVPQSPEIADTLG